MTIRTQGIGRPAVTTAIAALCLAAAAPSALAQSEAPAGSQQGSLPSGSQQQQLPAQGSLHGIATGSVAGLTYLGGSVPLGSVLDGVDSVGSADFPRPGGPTNHGEDKGKRDQAITETGFVTTEPMYPNSTDPEDKRAEVWTVNSKAMQRAIRVEVFHAPDEVQGPAVYFLDGLGSADPGGWAGGMGWGDPAMKARKMTVVAPMGGPSSMWSDWNSDDPHLGANEWETFLSKELPSVMKDKLGDSWNGHMGALGVSMGAAGALNLVNRANRGDLAPTGDVVKGATDNVQTFDAAGGVSGCYSTTDPLGYQYTRLTVEASGGTPEKMWGARDSEAWKKHDTLADHTGLDGKRVYLSSATGLIGSTDLTNFGSDEQLLVEGHILEKGSNESTRALENSLRTVGGDQVRADYEPTGIHNWPVFVPRMASALDHMLGADGQGIGKLGKSSQRKAAEGAQSPLGSVGSSSGSLGSLDSAIGSVGSSRSGTGSAAGN